MDRTNYAIVAVIVILTFWAGGEFREYQIKQEFREGFKTFLGGFREPPPWKEQKQ